MRYIPQIIPLKKHYFFVAVVLVFACKGRPVADNGNATGKDSVREALGNGSVLETSSGLLNGDSSIHLDTEQFEGPVTRFASFRFGKKVVSLQSFYIKDPDQGSDDPGPVNFLILRDDDEKVADTLVLETDDVDMSKAKMADVSAKLKFSSLVLQVRTWGRSDEQIDEFIEYKDGKLGQLFSIGFLRQISRKDENTLSAIVRGRDDILAEPYDYPVIVNLQDHSVSPVMPDIEVIKRSTRALEPFIAFKNNGEGLTDPHEIKTGTSLFIDTFFRATGIVRILLPDSTPVFIKKDDLFQKVETNTAG